MLNRQQRSINSLLRCRKDEISAQALRRINLKPFDILLFMPFHYLIVQYNFKSLIFHITFLWFIVFISHQYKEFWLLVALRHCFFSFSYAFMCFLYGRRSFERFFCPSAIRAFLMKYSYISIRFILDLFIKKAPDFSWGAYALLIVFLLMLFALKLLLFNRIIGNKH